MHAHVGPFYPHLKPEVAASFAFYRSKRRPGFTLSDDSVRICSLFRVVTTDARALPLLPALQFPARGYELRIDVESDASGSIGWGVIRLPPLQADSPVLYAHGLWTPREKKAHINTQELWVTLLTAFIFGDSHPAHWVMEAIDNTTARANAANNKAKTPEMRRILKARAVKHDDIGWTTAQQHITSSANGPANARSRDDLKTFFANADARGIARERLQRIYIDRETHEELQALLEDSNTTA